MRRSRHRTRGSLFAAALVLVMVVCMGGAEGGEIQSYGLFKGQQMIVVDLGFTKITKLDQAEFRAWAKGETATSISTASVQTPSGSILTLTNEPRLSGLAVKDTLAQLESAYPKGTYRISLNTSSGAAPSAQVILPTSAYPGAPELQNASMLTAINGAVDYQLSWKPMMNPDPQSVVGVAVVDRQDRTLYSTPLPGAPGALPGTTTSVTIPPSAWGVLAFGKTNALNIHVTFYHVTGTDTTSVVGAAGLSGFYTTTRYMAMVTSVPVHTPAITNFGLALGAVAYQTNEPPVTLKTSGAAAFSWAETYDRGRVEEVSLVRPGGVVRLLNADTTRRAYELQDEYGSVEQLMGVSAYPVGTYHLEIQQPEICSLLIPVAMAGDDFPAFAQVQNYTACQQVDPLASFEVRWAVTGANPLAFAQLFVETPSGTKVFQTAGLGTPNRLPLSTGAAVIPSKTLLPGQRYTAILRVYRETAEDASTLPGASGHTGYFADTRFSLTTTGEAVPEFSQLQIAGLLALDPVVVGQEVWMTPQALNAVLPVKWSLASGQLPAGVTLSPETGTISGHPQAAGTYTFEAQVTDQAQRTAKASVTLTVTGLPPLLSFTSAELPDSTENGAYYSSALSYSGGVEPLKWAVPEGQLPAGIVLYQDGVIRGDPIEGGTFFFNVQATDALGQTINQPFQLTIPPIHPEAIESIDSFTIGAEGSVELQASGTSDAAYTIEQGSEVGSWQAVATPNDLVNVKAVLPGSGGAGARFYRLNVVQSNTPAAPWNVQAIPDTARALQDCVNTNGTVLSVTDVQGATYNLTIPPGALPGSRRVKMSPILGMIGAGGEAVGGSGVILEPDGTRFTVPGLLTIDYPGPLTNALLYSGSGLGTDLHPVIATVEGNQMRVPVLHFTIFRIDTAGQEQSDSRSCGESAEAATKLWKFGQLPKSQRTFSAVVKIYRDYIKTVTRNRIEPAVGDESYLDDATGALAEWKADTASGDIAVASLVSDRFPALQTVLKADFDMAKRRLTLAYKNAVFRNRDRCTKQAGPAQGFKVRYYAEQAIASYEKGLINAVDRQLFGKIVQDCLRLRWSFQAGTKQWCSECIEGINYYYAGVGTPRKGYLVYDFRSKEWLDDDSVEPWVPAVPDVGGVGSSPKPSGVTLKKNRVSHLPSLIMKESPLQPKTASSANGCTSTYFDFELKSVSALWAPLGAFEALLGSANLGDTFFQSPLLTIMTEKGLNLEFDSRTATSGWRLTKIAPSEEREGWRLVDGASNDGAFAKYLGFGTKGTMPNMTHAWFKIFLYYDPKTR